MVFNWLNWGPQDTHQHRAENTNRVAIGAGDDANQRFWQHQGKVLEGHTSFQREVFEYQKERDAKRDGYLEKWFALQETYAKNGHPPPTGLTHQPGQGPGYSWAPQGGQPRPSASWGPQPQSYYGPPQGQFGQNGAGQYGYGQGHVQHGPYGAANGPYGLAPNGRPAQHGSGFPTIGGWPYTGQLFGVDPYAAANSPRYGSHPHSGGYSGPMPGWGGHAPQHVQHYPQPNAGYGGYAPQHAQHYPQPNAGYGGYAPQHAQHYPQPNGGYGGYAPQRVQYYPQSHAGYGQQNTGGGLGNLPLLVNSSQSVTGGAAQIPADAWNSRIQRGWAPQSPGGLLYSPSPYQPLPIAILPSGSQGYSMNGTAPYSFDVVNRRNEASGALFDAETAGTNIEEAIAGLVNDGLITQEEADGLLKGHDDGLSELRKAFDNDDSAGFTSLFDDVLRGQEATSSNIGRFRDVNSEGGEIKERLDQMLADGKINENQHRALTADVDNAITVAKSAVIDADDGVTIEGGEEIKDWRVFNEVNDQIDQLDDDLDGYERTTTAGVADLENIDSRITTLENQIAEEKAKDEPNQARLDMLQDELDGLKKERADTENSAYKNGTAIPAEKDGSPNTEAEKDGNLGKATSEEPELREQRKDGTSVPVTDDSNEEKQTGATKESSHNDALKATASNAEDGADVAANPSSTVEGDSKKKEKSDEEPTYQTHFEARQDFINRRRANRLNIANTKGANTKYGNEAFRESKVLDKLQADLDKDRDLAEKGEYKGLHRDNRIIATIDDEIADLDKRIGNIPDVNDENRKGLVANRTYLQNLRGAALFGADNAQEWIDAIDRERRGESYGHLSAERGEKVVADVLETGETELTEDQKADLKFDHKGLERTGFDENLYDKRLEGEDGVVRINRFEERQADINRRYHKVNNDWEDQSTRWAERAELQKLQEKLDQDKRNYESGTYKGVPISDKFTRELEHARSYNNKRIDSWRDRTDRTDDVEQLREANAYLDRLKNAYLHGADYASEWVKDNKFEGYGKDEVDFVIEVLKQRNSVDGIPAFPEVKKQATEMEFS